jgi:GrpB-like predicted nucleotidyltransferase (UPF0157 family)
MPSPARVRLVAYDPQWPELFEREASRIRALLNVRAVNIEHIGSTSVPGLVAKERMLRFRNWLRANAADRELYESTKSALAAKAWPSVDDYAAAKTAVVETILARATARA